MIFNKIQRLLKKLTRDISYGEKMERKLTKQILEEGYQHDKQGKNVLDAMKELEKYTKEPLNNYSYTIAGKKLADVEEKIIKQIHNDVDLAKKIAKMNKHNHLALKYEILPIIQLSEQYDEILTKKLLISQDKEKIIQRQKFLEAHEKLKQQISKGPAYIDQINSIQRELQHGESITLAQTEQELNQSIRTLKTTIEEQKEYKEKIKNEIIKLQHEQDIATIIPHYTGLMETVGVIIDREYKLNLQLHQTKEALMKRIVHNKQKLFTSYAELEKEKPGYYKIRRENINKKIQELIHIIIGKKEEENESLYINLNDYLNKAA
jgi:hypothetical protein